MILRRLFLVSLIANFSTNVKAFNFQPKYLLFPVGFSCIYFSKYIRQNKEAEIPSAEINEIFDLCKKPPEEIAKNRSKLKRIFHKILKYYVYFVSVNFSSAFGYYLLQKIISPEQNKNQIKIRFLLNSKISNLNKAFYFLSI